MSARRRSWPTRLRVVGIAVVCGLATFLLVAAFSTVLSSHAPLPMSPMQDEFSRGMIGDSAACGISSGSRDVTVGREAAITFVVGDRDQCDGVNVSAPIDLATDRLLFDAELTSLSDDVEIRAAPDNRPQAGPGDHSWRWTVIAETPGTHDLVISVSTYDADRSGAAGPNASLLGTKTADTPVVLNAQGIDTDRGISGLLSADGPMMATASAIAGIVSAVVSVLALRRTKPEPVATSQPQNAVVAGPEPPRAAVSEAPTPDVAPAPEPDPPTGT